MSTRAQSLVRNPFFVGGLILLLAAAGLALAGFTPAQFGHSTDEIHFDSMVQTQTCTGKFCRASCPANYYVVGGGCSATTDRKTQFNLSGASGDQTGWDCFDSNGSGPVMSTAICLHAGAFAPQSYQFCGNYTVESPAPPGNFNEICDLNNTGTFDCSDVLTGNGQPLCNGLLTCGSNCGDLDAAACQFCNTGNCPAGQIICADNTCGTNCDNNGGGLGSGVLCGGACACSGGNCGGPPMPPDNDPNAFCGNLVLELGEACDGTTQGCGAETSIVCPANQHLNIAVSCQSCACVTDAYCSCNDGGPTCQSGVCNECEPDGPPSFCTLGCCPPCSGGGGGGPQPN